MLWAARRSGAARRLESLQQAIPAAPSHPTARHRTFTRASFDANYVREPPTPIVVKADGLAAGKGVIIAASADEALAAAAAMFAGEFGAAGNEIVIEEFLPGEEASFIVMADGEHALALASSQDHKRRDDGDRGPNTGGMGAYSPAPLVTAALPRAHHARGDRTCLAGTRAEACRTACFLYAGLMIAPDGTPNVVEFNCRLGDPEAQPLLMRMQSDLTLLCSAALAGRLHEAEVKWDPRAALGVVMAAAGYPGSVRSGDVIDGLDAAALLPGKVFHGATRVDTEQKRIVTSGGRVLCAVGMGQVSALRSPRRMDSFKEIRWKGRTVSPRHRPSRGRAGENAAAR